MIYKNSRWKLAGAITVGLGILLFAWWASTPSFGLAQLYWAASFKNEALFRSRVDVKKVAQGFASDFVEAQIPKMEQGGLGGDILTKILIPFREQFEAKTTEAVEEFVTDYFAKDPHGYMELIRWLPLAAVKHVLDKNPDFHLLDWPVFQTDQSLSMLKLKLVWWQEPKEVIAKLEKLNGRWVVTRVIISSL